MIKSKLMRWFLCLMLMTTIVTGLVGSQLAFAEEDSLTLSTDYPILKDAVGGSFSFSVSMEYKGTQPRVFDLSTQVPVGAAAQVMSSDSKEIASIRIDPSIFSRNYVTVIFIPNFRRTAEPGEYKMALNVKSGNLSQSIELTAMITAKYGVHFEPQSGMFSATITAGQDNHLAIRVMNQSTVPLESIALTIGAPDGWGATFTPSKIDSIPANFEVLADAVIRPPKNTVAGDYQIRINAESKNASDSQTMRLTVETPTIWGWVGIIIVVGVIAGLGVIFRQLGRR
ncbi:MAG: hypothetical protein HY667_06530 [Chloroflexi bacterium]|nr:hypothetical protein [Chloroflexota bacterium]